MRLLIRILTFAIFGNGPCDFGIVLIQPWCEENVHHTEIAIVSHG